MCLGEDLVADLGQTCLSLQTEKSPRKGAWCVTLSTKEGQVAGAMSCGDNLKSSQWEDRQRP